jgi:hypothetical protein
MLHARILSYATCMNINLFCSLISLYSQELIYIAMSAKCRDVPNDLVILMAAYEELPRLVGQKFQTEHLFRKTT